MNSADAGAVQALALHYDGRLAPTVTAKADAALAGEMLRLALQHGVPVHRDPALLRLLAEVRLDAEIPLGLFVAVAEVLAFTRLLRDDLRQDGDETGRQGAAARP